MVFEGKPRKKHTHEESVPKFTVSFEGNLNLFSRLYEKKSLLEAGLPHDHIRPYLITCEGGLRGAPGAAVLQAFEQAGFIHPKDPSKDVFDGGGGFSSGFSNLAYFLSGDAEKNVDLYEECVRRGLFSFVRSAFGQGPVADIDLLCRLMRGQEGDRPLNEDRIHASRTKLYAGVTHYRTRGTLLMDAKSIKPDIAEAARLSAAMPGFYKPYVEYEGERYMDGAFNNPFPWREIRKTFPDMTDVVVVLNAKESTIARGPTLSEHIGLPFFLSEWDRPRYRATRHLLFRRGLENMRNDPSCNYIIVSPNQDLSVTHESPSRIRAAIREVKTAVSRALDRIPTAGREGDRE